MLTDPQQPAPRTIARQCAVVLFWLVAASYFLFRLYSGTISTAYAAIVLTLCLVMVVAQAAVMVVTMRNRRGRERP